MHSKENRKQGRLQAGRGVWTAVLAGVVAVAAVISFAKVSSAGPNIPAFKLDSWKVEHTFAAAPKTPVAKPAHPTPPAEIAQTQPVQGLLAAEVGPVPLPARLYQVQNKWLGDVNGAFTGVYAGADAKSPQTGLLAVFQPSNSAAPLKVYRTAAATGALRITGVSGTTVTFTFAGGQGTFDLATRQFGQ